LSETIARPKDSKWLLRVSLIQSKGLSVRVRGAGDESEADDADDEEAEDDEDEDEEDDGTDRSNGEEDEEGGGCDERDKSASIIITGST
jgi:hypothetical protein